MSEGQSIPTFHGMIPESRITSVESGKFLSDNRDHKGNHDFLVGDYSDFVDEFDARATIFDVWAFRNG